jgi:hypothetical protein
MTVKWILNRMIGFRYGHLQGGGKKKVMANYITDVQI